NPVAGDGRFDVDQDPAGREQSKELVPTGLGQNPVRYRQDQPVQAGEGFQRNQFDTVFASCLLRVGERIGNQRRNAKLPQFGDDIGDPAVAQIRHVFLKGDADDADPGTLDRTFGGDQQLDQTLGDKTAHAVIDAPARQYDLRVIAGCLRAG